MQFSPQICHRTLNQSRDLNTRTYKHTNDSHEFFLATPLPRQPNNNQTQPNVSRNAAVQKRSGSSAVQKTPNRRKCSAPVNASGRERDIHTYALHTYTRTRTRGASSSSSDTFWLANVYIKCVCINNKNNQYKYLL